MQEDETVDLRKLFGSLGLYAQSLLDAMAIEDLCDI